MTKRLFYTCAIEALYMMKHFGVKLECDYTPEEKIEYDQEDNSFDFKESDLGEPNTVEDLVSIFESFRRIYVHPDSMQVFEPVDGDIFGAFGLFGSYLGKDAITVPERINGKAHYVFPKNSGKIIQRKGRPFICPQEEQA